MALDGVMLSSVISQLNKTLVGGRIDKIVQPERDEIHMIIRAGGENRRLLLCCNAQRPRIHLTQIAKKSMETPPQLCMLLRKHILSGRVIEFAQIGMDRIARMTIEAMDELGDYSRKHLIVEIMGKHSNLIFTDADMRIIDSARRVTADISRVREVLPHLPYEFPPAQDKLDVRACRSEMLAQKLLEHSDWALDKAIMSCVSGVSPQCARELAYRFFMDEKAAPSVWRQHAEAIARDTIAIISGAPNQTPAVYYGADGQVADVTAFEYQSFRELEKKLFDTPSEALDAYYGESDSADRIHRRAASMVSVLKNALERCEKKLAQQLEKQEEVKGREELRIDGELLMASLHLVVKGAKFVTVPNYYVDGMPQRAIELDEKLSPTQNAQRYFKKYAKAKAAAELLEGQIAQNASEIDYLSSALYYAQNLRDESEVEQLRAELVKTGYIKNTERQRSKSLESSPQTYTAPDGTTVLAGRNNLQNDRLTFGAQANDVWLHAKDMPGSHVIICTQNGTFPSDETLLFAASVAAAHSKGRASSAVPVDYTLKKYVKKPTGAKPGYVIYTNQKTILAKPIEQMK